MNKLLTSNVISVVPVEAVPMVNGELTDDQTPYTSSATDSDGAAYDISVNTANVVKATWLPIGSSNRKTSPDVRRGESVVLYQFGDSDEFWWTTLHYDMQLRKLETVIYTWSGTQDEKADPNADNNYFLEISTHNKNVTFHTSKTNGEPFAYTFQFNTADGIIILQDDAGQYFELNSKERQLILENNDGSKVEVNKTNIFFESKDLISLKSKTITEESTHHVITATNLDITATTSHKGDIADTGNITQTGNQEVTGSVHATVKVSTAVLLAGTMGIGTEIGGSGTATFAGTITTQKLISAEDIIAPNVGN